MIRTLIISAISLVLLGGGIAPAAQPTPVPDNPPDFSSMNFLLGTWHCHQTIAGRPGDRTETDTYTMAYDGWQMRAHFVSPPFDKYRNRDVVGDAWTTYDPKLKIWINEVADNFGAYGLMTSPGWVGNTITWKGTNPDGTVFKLVETKLSDTKETFKSWVNTEKGRPLVNTLTQACSKSHVPG